MAECRDCTNSQYRWVLVKEGHYSTVCNELICHFSDFTTFNTTTKHKTYQSATSFTAFYKCVGEIVWNIFKIIVLYPLLSPTQNWCCYLYAWSPWSLQQCVWYSCSMLYHNEFPFWGQNEFSFISTDSCTFPDKNLTNSKCCRKIIVDTSVSVSNYKVLYPM